MKKNYSLIISFLFAFFLLQTNNLNAQCNYSLELIDSYGDGWNGASLDVYIDGVTTSHTFTSGFSSIVPLSVNTGDSLALIFTNGGSYASEVSFELKDAGGSVLYSSGTSPAVMVHYELASVTCPACLPPTNPTVSSITVSSASLDWTENNAITSWSLEYGLKGFTPGSGTTVAVSSKPYSLTGLTSSTEYDWYITSDCGGNGTSPALNAGSFTTAFACPVGAVCATYNSGGIASDIGFQSLPGSSTCSGSMSVVIPSGNRVDSISTSYDVTAANGAYMSEQRSYLYSPTTVAGEGALSSGTGTGGTYSYSRDGLTFANGATGTVQIDMHL